MISITLLPERHRRASLTILRSREQGAQCAVQESIQMESQRLHTEQVSELIRMLRSEIRRPFDGQRTRIGALQFVHHAELRDTQGRRGVWQLLSPSSLVAHD